MFTWFQDVKNRCKIALKFKKKQLYKKHTPLLHFLLQNRFFMKKCSQRGPGTMGNEPWFSSLFRPWTPKGAPGAPKGPQSEPRGAPGTQKLSKKVPKSKKIGAKVCRKCTKSHHMFFCFLVLFFHTHVASGVAVLMPSAVAVVGRRHWIYIYIYI